ncbi:MAG: hypothetical protein WCJ19_05280 [bacterium]
MIILNKNKRADILFLKIRENINDNRNNRIYKTAGKVLKISTYFVFPLKIKYMTVKIVVNKLKKNKKSINYFNDSKTSLA